MFDFLFEYRGFIVGFIFLALISACIAATIYGRKLIRTEKTDAVFGDPERALGGWHWVVTGVSAILLIWFYFSWDTARAFFPKAANELCQVAKLEYATNPIRSTFALDNSYLRGSSLIKREVKQIDGLKLQIDSLGLNETQKSSAFTTIQLMESSLKLLSTPDNLDPETVNQINRVKDSIIQLTAKLKDDSYPGAPTAEQIEKANSQGRWGDSGDEIPLHPASPRGYKFDAAAKEMRAIAIDFSKVRNQNAKFLNQVEQLKGQIESLEQLATESGKDDSIVQARKDFSKSLTRVLRRIDDGLIFPPNAMDGLEAALVDLEKEQQDQQGGLSFIDAWIMPGGKISSGSSSCSEQGSGRWLPKPSDTLRTMTRISDPNIGYKGYPLLWYKQKPFGEMVDFVVPDFLSSLIPGDFPRHSEDGKIGSNFKSKVHNFATGNFDSFSLPVPSGHIWDSLLRVLAGLFFGIILGVPLGLFMGLSRFSKGFFDPLIELYRPVPPLAWAPLILTIFGIQDDGKIFLLFMVAFAIMVISARTGASGTHLSKIRAAHSLGASNQQILRQVILPNSLPEILTGIRIAIGVCWGTLVAAEMLAGTTGIGFVENVARKQSDYEIIWTTIIILGLLGLLFDLIMRWVIDKVIPWRGKG
ncbi:MAG: ABC transporter permease [Arenicella sp.]